jgi:hypothetical protein
MSTIAETISALENYNKWRRGDDTLPMPDPFETGVAIGDAVRLLRELAAERAKVRLLRAALESLAYWSRNKTESRITLRNLIAAALAATEESK